MPIAQRSGCFVAFDPMNGAGCGVAMGATLSSEDDLPQRDRWARLRFAIIGPLLAAPPAAGELHEELTVLAAKTWRHPFHRARRALRRLDDRALAVCGKKSYRSRAGAA